MNDIKNKTKEELLRDMKPTGAYLDSLSGFADLLGTIKQAENAAKELIDETSDTAKKSNQTNKPDQQPNRSRSNNANENSNTQKNKSEEEAQQEVEEEQVEEKSVEELLETLDTLIGLDNIKQSVKSLINFVKVRTLREETGFTNPPV